MKVLITGGSGFLGTHLIQLLKSQGANVSILSRKLQNGVSTFLWDPTKGSIDISAFNDVNTIIHMAGAGIADKMWTAEYKKEIIDSRVRSASLLFESLKKAPGHSIKTFVSASAVGYYGACGDEWLEEDFHSKEDFLGSVCNEWEKSARHFESLGIRVVILKIGIVLAKDGGALPQLALPVKSFVGAPLGSGNQYMSWIHVNDLCRIFSYAITNEKLHGTYNAVAPGPVTNKFFIKEIAKVLKKPVWPFKVPSFVLKMILGEKAAIVLDGQRVSSEKIRLSGFEFNHTDLNKTLKDLL